MTNDLPVLWDKNIRGVSKLDGDLKPVLITADPHERGRSAGINVRAFLVDDPGESLMTLKSYYEAGVVHVGNGHLLVNEDYRGQGIGSACLTKAFLWAKHYYPDTPLSHFKIGNSKTKKEADALQRLYESFGMRFPKPRPEIGSWFCLDLKCSDITIPVTLERVDGNGMSAIEIYLGSLRKRVLDRSKDVGEAFDLAASMSIEKTFYKWGMIAALVVRTMLTVKLITA